MLVAAFLPSAPGHRAQRRISAAPLPDLRLLAGAVLAWELTGVALGGSYWLHYLIGTVPGLVLASAAVVVHHPTRTRWIRMALTYGAIVSLTSTVGLALHDRDVPSDTAVATYLIAHQQQGDTGVVSFGNPAILENAHLSSPYPELWSLPVRVRDPLLSEFTQVLSGPDRPDWVVVNGATLATWGVDATGRNPCWTASTSGSTPRVTTGSTACAPQPPPGDRRTTPARRHRRRPRRARGTTDG